MSGRNRICFTFVGDCTRDSRLTRFLESLSGTYDVSLIALAPDRRSFAYAGAEVIQFGDGGLPLRSSLRRFWRDAKPQMNRMAADVYVAADLYSLPAASAAAARTGAPLVYDARELYSAIASLHHRPFTQLYWTLLEKRHARRAALILTVNQSIGDILRAAFPAVAVQVFRNVPRVPDVIDPVDLRSMLNIPAGMTILLVLGGLQAGRGILPSVEALAGLPECVLICLGSGPLREEILRVAETRGVGGRVHIVDTVPSKEVLRYAAGADVGLCMIENLGRSYYLSLPNKLFECIAAGVPVVGSSFPEIETVIRESGVGVTAAPQAPGIVEAVRMLVQDRDLYAACKARCVAAAARHAWQAEEARFRALFDGLVQRA